MSNAAMRRAGMLFSTSSVAESMKTAALAPAKLEKLKSGKAKSAGAKSAGARSASASSGARASRPAHRFAPRASALFATTSIAALLLGGAPVEAGGLNVANVIFTGSGPTGGISNTGTIIATALNGIGISIGGAVPAAAAVTNSGTIIARGAASGTGVLVGDGLTGGITNTGTIFGSSDAIKSISFSLGGKATLGSGNSIDQAIQINGTTITQSAGALIGGVVAVGSGADILNVTGGALSLQPTSIVFGLATLNQSGGNVVLQVMPSTAAGQFPTVNVGNLTLTGVLEVAPQSGSFAPGQTITYANVFTGSSSLNNGIANVLVFDFFSNAVSASLTPGNTSPLSLTLTNNSGMQLTPGVASGAGTFTTLTNPLGAILPAVSVTKGASVNGAIVNLGFIGIRIHQNGFTEGGGIAALTGTAKDFDVQTTTLGVRSELAFASLPVSVTTMLAWRHAYGNVVPSVLLGFQGGAQAFSVSGIPIDHAALVAETGVNYAVTSMLTLGLSYSGQFGQGATDNAFKGNLNLRF